MTKWQLPQGVEYPIDIRGYEADLGWRVIICRHKSSRYIHNEKSLNIMLSNESAAHSIRINNSIDLVKIEE